MLFETARVTRIAAHVTVLGMLAACGSGGDSRLVTAASTSPAGVPASASTPVAGSTAAPTQNPVGPQPLAASPTMLFAATPQSGGAATLDDVGSVSFPPNGLSSAATVQLRKTRSDWVQGVFEDTAVMFQAVVRAPYELRITLGATQPIAPVDIELSIPGALRAQASPADEVRVMAMNVYESEDERLESVEVVGPRARPSDTSVRAQLAPEYFQPNAQGQYEAHVFLALTPTAPGTSAIAQTMRKAFDRLLAAVNPVSCAHAAGQSCAGASLARPVNEQFAISSGFGRRTAPRAGGSTDHRGIDFAVPVGTPVKAAANGTLELARYQRHRDTGKVVGWGYYVVLRHADGGATLYAHLTAHSEKLPVGSAVRAGDVIAFSGNTGTGTGPHLHFEYAPSGKIFVDDRKVDPRPCLERLGDGTIVVRDNGYAADDSFSISLDGKPLCSTVIGEPNSCAIGTLRPGRYSLSVKVDEAPDDMGTYEVILNSHNMLIDGAKRVSGSPRQGATIDHVLMVGP